MFFFVNKIINLEIVIDEIPIVVSDKTKIENPVYY